VARPAGTAEDDGPAGGLSGLPVDFRPGTDVRPPAGAKARAAANLGVLRLLQDLRTQDRYATAAEQETLARWSSWGAVPQVFEDHREDWANERAELKELLTPAEYAQASATTINAHYTDPAVVKAVWDSMEAAGFDGGTVLEPGCGPGTFIGLAPDSAVMAGVELDSTTARIASLLYPSAQVRAEGFEQSPIPEGAVSAVVGNVPFGDFVVHDARYNTSRLSIHNYFIAKSLRLTAPGGYVAVLTSTYTMDAQSAKARRQIAKYGDLVGAVRLPTNAFKAVAGTEVMTDLLVFRRRKDAEKPDEDRIRGWVDVSTTWAQHRETGQPTKVSVGGHFADNDDALLGVLSVGQGMYNDSALELSGPAGHQLADLIRENLGAQLAEAAEAGLGYAPEPITVPEGTFTSGLQFPAGAAEAVTGHVRYDGATASFERFNAGRAWVSATCPKTRVQESLALLGIRDTVRNVIDSQRAAAPENERVALREELTARYDAYVSAYGPLNRAVVTEARPRSAADIAARMATLEREWRAALPIDGSIEPGSSIVPAEVKDVWREQAEQSRPATRTQEHLKILRGDPSLGLVLALEVFDEASGTTTKAAVFERDVLAFRERPERAETAADALAISLDETRSVDLDRIAGLLGVETSQAREMLGSTVFPEPGTGALIPAVKYLSGDVRGKLATARAAAEVDGSFLANVEALEGVLPEQVSAMDIIAKPGVRYAEPTDYETFIAETFDVPVTVSISPTDGTWELRGTAGAAKYAPAVRFDYATPDRTPVALLQSLMNNRTITIRRTIHDENGAERQVKDVKATLEARDKAAKIADEFGSWLFRDAARAARVTGAYNVMFNSHVSTDYKAIGEGLSLPGLDASITPHAYQRSAVARVVNEPTVLLDHVVGAGKTGTMVMSAMELRRTGIAQKPAIVVPNHLVDQVSREFIQWYPSANVLAIPTGINANERAFWVAAAATGDWDAVVIPSTVFGKIQVDPARTQVWLEEQIVELREAKAGMSSEEKSRIKAVEKAIKRIEERHGKITTGKDTGVTFEETGIDYLFVDEAHHYKNLFRQSDSYELACTGSDRASDLDFKLRALRETKVEDARRGGYHRDGYLPAVATFATGTPVANSMSEMWVMQHYLRPDLLEKAGLVDVNSWANQFTERSTVLRISPAGGGYDQVERINKYINVPELVGLTAQFSDVITVSDITAKLPVLTGGERRLISREPSLAVAEYVEDLGQRAKNLSGVDPRDDNMPKITNDGRMVALDPRLKGLTADADGGRPAQVAAEVWAIHERTKDTVYTAPDGNPSPVTGGLQLLFCDRAVPNNAGRFSMYDAIRDNLVEHGMERELIAFIHEAPNDIARAELFDKCRDGRVSVLIGSTERMGTGTNVQARAVALHHVDVPWRPADLEQREGRVLRQGNQNDETTIRSYATAQTFDVYMWDMVARKAKFINQLKTGGVQGRSMDDGFGDLELSAGQAAAALSGDPRLEQLASMQMEESKLQSLFRSYTDAKRRSKGELTIAHSALGAMERDLPVLAAALPGLSDTRGDAFTMTVGAQEYRERVGAAGALHRTVLASVTVLPAGAGPYVRLGTVASLPVEGRCNNGTLELMLAGSGHALVRVVWAEFIKAEPLGLVRRLENTAAALPRIHQDLLERQTTYRQAIPSLEETLAMPFEHAAELTGLQQKISDLMTDMGLNQDEDEQVTEAPPVAGETLRLLAGNTDKFAVSGLRDGDVVTGIQGRGQQLFRVGSVKAGDGAVLRPLGDADERSDDAHIAYFRDVELVNRPQRTLTRFERVFLSVKDTDAVATKDTDVRNGDRITVERRTLDPETGTETGKVMMVTGTVEVAEGEWRVTDDAGSSHRFRRSSWAALTPVLRHDVIAPDAVAKEAASPAAAAATMSAQDFLPGDVLLEDVTGLGLRGDVATGATLYWGTRFIDPDMGMERKNTDRYVPAAVSYQPGRLLTTEETAQLFPDGFGDTVGDLRPGDIVSVHELDRNQSRRGNVTVTGRNSGTMVDFRYRFDDGATGVCRRRTDQSITVHARRYGALTTFENALLQAPGKVREQAAALLTREHVGQWVRLSASPGTVPAWNKSEIVLGRLIEAERIPAPDARSGPTLRLQIEAPGGTRSSWAAQGNTTTLLWDGELPETPLDFSGVSLDMAPVPVTSPPVAPADIIEELATGFEDHLIISTVDLPAAKAPAEATPAIDPPEGAPVLEHSAEGTTLTGVGRENKALHGALKDSGFKFSRRQEFWYLPRNYKTSTRDMNVRQLLSAAGRLGEPISLNEAEGERRMAILKTGDWVSIRPGTATIHGIDAFGMPTAVKDFPAMVGKVGANPGQHRVPVEVTVAGKVHTFEISGESGALEVMDSPETAPSLPDEVSVTLDRIAGRRVCEVEPGQRISVSGKAVTLEALQSFQRERFDDALVLAVEPGPVQSVQYLLLDRGTDRLWVEATAMERVPVIATEPVHETHFAPPRFRRDPLRDVTTGEKVAATGIRSSTVNTRIEEIVSASGTLAAIVRVNDTDYDLTIDTRRGPVTLRQGPGGYLPEVTTMVSGTTQGWVPPVDEAKRSVTAAQLSPGDILVNASGERATVVATRPAGEQTEVMVTTGSGEKGVIKAEKDRPFIVEKPKPEAETAAPEVIPVIGPAPEAGPFL
jgi:N12 class adenine-specific DNA methylase